MLQAFITSRIFGYFPFSLLRPLDSLSLWPYLNQLLLHFDYVLQVVQVAALDALFIPTPVISFNGHIAFASWATIQSPHPYKPPTHVWLSLQSRSFLYLSHVTVAFVSDWSPETMVAWFPLHLKKLLPQISG